MSRIAQTGRDFIDYVKVVLENYPESEEDPEYSEAKEYIKAVIERDIVPLYEAYKSGDDSRRYNLEELKWYYEILKTMDDRDWKYAYEEARHSYLDSGPIYEEEEQVGFEDIWKNVEQMGPLPEDMDVEEKTTVAPKQESPRRPVEKIMVKPTQGNIKEPASVGSFVYSRDEGSEGQIKEILSEDKIKVINSKNNKEEVWSTENLHLSNKTR